MDTCIMELILYALITLLTIIVVIYLNKGRCNHLRRFPGPRGLPFIGNALQLDRDKPFIQLASLAKKFGPILKLNLFGKPVLVVSRYEELYEMLVQRGNDFAGRPRNFSSDFLSLNRCDFFANFTPQLLAYKKLLMSHVKASGSGQKRIEDIVCTVAQENVQSIKQVNGQPLDIRTQIQDATTDIIYLLAFCRKGTAVEKQVVAGYLQKTQVEIYSGSAGGDFFINLFPWLRFFGLPVWKMMKAITESQRKQYLKWRGEVITKIDAGENVDRNFLAKFLQVLDGENQFGLTENHAHAVIWAMFAAGVTTTTSTLMTVINVLVHKPDIQQKLYDEWETVLGSREISLTDRQDMHYHQAVILEALRYSSIVPFALPHETMCSTELSGHTIPAGTMVWPNLWALHHDEDIWGDPFEFRPERYIDDEGCLVLADHPSRKHTLAFGAGSRVCAAELFALSRLFLMLAMLVKHFEILPATTLEEQPSCDCRTMVNGLVLFPPHYEVRFRPRE